MKNVKISEEKKLSLNTALSQIEKQYGKGSIMRLGEKSKFEIDSISTGALTVDIALGGKGIPKGRITEVFGPEGSGKTTLCLSVVANCQKGGTAAYIDVEHAIDPSWSKKIGVDLENLLLSQPDSGEQALDIAEILVRSNSVDLIVVDSVAALVPKSELEGDIGDQHIGLQARLMSQALRKLCAAIDRSNTAVVFINQLREKIGVFFGNPETTPGGRALKFYSSCRIDVRKISVLKDSEKDIGVRVRGTIVKNKLSPPFKKAEFDILYECGVSLEGSVLDLGEETGTIARQGAWFVYGDTKLGQGREKARAFLSENKKIRDELITKIRANLH
ncbi:MAG: recombinase RecA [Planctomycetes bacterium]|nr:recombinase RecA [Planctomycetota bacterium]